MKLLNFKILSTIILISFVLTSFELINKSENNDKTQKEKENKLNKKESKGTPNNLNFLRKMNGKYPFEVKLLDNKIVKNRLIKLIGSRYNFIKEISAYGPSEPIEIKNNIMTASVCQQHNCGSTNFILVVDLLKNIIYVGIRENNKIKTYSEDGSKSQRLNDWVKNNV